MKPSGLPENFFHLYIMLTLGEKLIMNTTNSEFMLTAEGIAALKNELKELSTNKRTEIAQRLKDAKADGDLSENSAWDAARDDQGFTEGRISEIEHILKHSKLIEHAESNIVSIGSTVHLELEDGRQHYTIVGSTEANPDEGKISNESPIGKALLGKKPGEEVEIQDSRSKISKL
jgi:transcription elongation factor GreA